MYGQIRLHLRFTGCCGPLEANQWANADKMSYLNVAFCCAQHVLGYRAPCIRLSTCMIAPH